MSEQTNWGQTNIDPSLPSEQDPIIDAEEEEDVVMGSQQRFGGSQQPREQRQPEEGFMGSQPYYGGESQQQPRQQLQPGEEVFMGSQPSASQPRRRPRPSSMALPPYLTDSPRRRRPRHRREGAHSSGYQGHQDNPHASQGGGGGGVNIHYNAPSINYNGTSINYMFQDAPNLPFGSGPNNYGGGPIPATWYEGQNFNPFNNTGYPTSTDIQRHGS